MSERNQPGSRPGHRSAGPPAGLMRFLPPGVRSVWVVAGLLSACVLGGSIGLVIHLSHTAQAGRVAALGTAPQLHVSGNQLVNASGEQVILRGVDRSGGEYNCVKGFGVWDGPMNQASVTAMRQWNVNAVRVPLNEACWNGESYVPRPYRGVNYRQAVQSYVRLLNRNGIVAILDLQWTDGGYDGPLAVCSSASATCAKPMPDAAQSIPFWASVARTFTGNDAVVFDVFNEPFPQGATGSAAQAWQCWRHGGSSCPGIGYPVAGMQQLVDAVRSAGADNVIMLGGIGWSDDLTQWLRNEPADPDHNLAASWHTYNFNRCASLSCWNSQVAPVIAKVPVIAGEIGENDCADTYIGPLMSWLDARSTGYLGWAWNSDFSCSAGPGLITSYAGTPTAFGAGFRSHLRSLK